jgi:hypothetical protein
MGPYLHQQRVLWILTATVHLQPAATRKGPTPRTVKKAVKLLFKKVKHQALGSTLLAAIAGKAVDRQRLSVRLSVHLLTLQQDQPLGYPDETVGSVRRRYRQRQPWRTS